MCVQAKFWDRLILHQILVVFKSPTTKIDFVDFLQIQAAFWKTNYTTFSCLLMPVYGQDMSENDFWLWPRNFDFARFLQTFALKALKYFSLPFTLFEFCGGVFIMNSNIHLRKNSLNEYIKAISHYFRVHSHSGFITAARWTYSSSSLLSLKFRFLFCRCLKILHGKDFQSLVEEAILCL